MNMKKMVQVPKIAAIHYKSTCESLTAINVAPKPVLWRTDVADNGNSFPISL